MILYEAQDSCTQKIEAAVSSETFLLIYQITHTI